MRKNKVQIVAHVGLDELLSAITDLAEEIPVGELTFRSAEKLEAAARNIRYRLNEEEKDKPRKEAIVKILSGVKLLNPNGEKE